MRSDSSQKYEDLVGGGAAMAAGGCVAANGAGSGSSLQELPDDVLALLSAAMSPADVIKLGATCRRLRAACAADKLWYPHCERIVVGVDLHSWRSAVASFQCLWRFAKSVESLIGMWVHQNPELGNLVSVMWGFVSVVGCRIIPQELGPHGLDRGLLWAPVFEIIGRWDGSPIFFLHGRENGTEELCYPGRFHLSGPSPNVLLLEAEPVGGSSVQASGSPRSPVSTLVFPGENSDDSGEELPRRLSKASSKDKGKKQTSPAEQIPFHRLRFGDRRRLLELLAPKIALQVQPLTSSPLFPRRKLERMEENGRAVGSADLQCLEERRARLLRLHGRGEQGFLNSEAGTKSQTGRVIDTESLLKILCTAPASSHSPSNVGPKQFKSPAGMLFQRGKKGGMSGSVVPLGPNTNGVDSLKKSGLRRFVVSKMKQMIGRHSSERFARPATGASTSEVKKLQLQEFLKQSRSIGLRLHAASWSLDFYKAFPIINDNQFALYKMPEQQPSEGMEYAGIWGGTFGWPPGRPAHGKPGKALFLLKISYEETTEGRLLTATKILEGTQYVLYPNGSAMFTARMYESSSSAFPWDKDMDGNPVHIMSAFPGAGISSGYGFLFPSSKPGDLFVDNAGQLSFVWRETKLVLMLMRLDLQTLLENGERVPALPPVANFAYLTKSYSNVFTGSSGHTQLGASAKSSSHVAPSPP